jgi:quinol monooxygenase YgiN
MKIHTDFGRFKLLLAGMAMLFSFNQASAQQRNQIVRLAKLVIDSAQLENFKTELKMGVETAVRVEQGVLTLYAMSEKKHATHFSILEIYSNMEAYKAHLETPHFKKYKAATKDMVRSLELIETTPLVPGMKIK